MKAARLEKVRATHEGVELISQMFLSRRALRSRKFVRRSALWLPRTTRNELRNAGVRYKGALVGYAAFKDHCSFFPMRPP